MRNPPRWTPPALDSCVRLCEEAERACSRALARALERGGLHADPERLRLLMECGRTCARSAQILLRGWWEQAPVCLECAELCEICASECCGSDDAELRACAAACRRCAQCCRRMAGRCEGRAAVLGVEDDAGDAA